MPAFWAFFRVRKVPLCGTVEVLAVLPIGRMALELLLTLLFYPLTAPEARPPYTCFWNTIKMIRIGMIVISTPAQI